MFPPSRFPAPVRLPAVMAAALLAGGCASLVPPAPGPGPGPGPVPAPPTRVPAPAASTGPLTAERQWLQAWFKDTPVRIAQRPDGAVTVDVPTAFCFDPGRTEVKPALAAVLDKVAESLRRVPQARLARLAAPDDDSVSAALAQERALRVQRHLRSRGVAVARLGTAVVTTEAAVQLRMEVPAPAP